MTKRELTLEEKLVLQCLYLSNYDDRWWRTVKYKVVKYLLEHY